MLIDTGSTHEKGDEQSSFFSEILLCVVLFGGDRRSQIVQYGIFYCRSVSTLVYEYFQEMLCRMFTAIHERMIQDNGMDKVHCLLMEFYVAPMIGSAECR